MLQFRVRCACLTSKLLLEEEQCPVGYILPALDAGAEHDRQAITAVIASKACSTSDSVL